MTPERYEEIRAAYVDLIDRPATERASRLDRLRQADPELGEEVEALLIRSGEDSALDRPIGDRRQLERVLLDAEASDEPPRQLGSYRILGRLGYGGMSKVYEAEQDNPRRAVALKVLPPALATPDAMKRLRREAEILGQLHHPGIARIYEAGVFPETTADPFPQAYIAMELVHGRSFADALKSASLADQLLAFVRVCDAVAHAHEQSIIHRDLKPSNIVVDDEGRPRVLDFGIGRYLDPEAEQVSLHTETGAILGTLAYMSPEQLRGGEVDTRTDVYALGVILYELTTSTLPIDPRGLSVPEATRRVHEAEPRPLGTHVTSLRGDLEVVVAKALEKDPDRRYGSARELSDDVRRFLRDEPILARRPSAIYHLRKFARRHRALAAGLSVVLVGLCIGIVGLGGGLIAAYDAIEDLELERTAARESAAAAKLEADRAVATRSFLFRLLRSGLPDRTRGEDVTVAQILRDSEGAIEELFGDEPLLEAWARQVVGQCHFELGDSQRARDHMERALILREKFGEPHDPELYQTLDGLARVQMELSELEAAEDLCRRALEGRTRVLGPEHPKTLTSRERLGLILYERDAWSEAEHWHRENRELFAMVHGPDHSETMGVVHNLGTALFSQGRYAEALEHYTPALESRREEFGLDHPKTLVTTGNQAMALLALDRADEAAPLLADTLARCRRVFSPDHRQTLDTMHHYAVACRRTNRLAEAKALYGELLERQTNTRGVDHPENDTLRANLAAVLTDLGETDAAVELCRAAVAASLRRNPRGNFVTVVALSNCGRALQEAGRVDEARETFVEALAVCDGLDLPPSHFGPHVIRCNYSRCLVDLGRQEEARPLLLESLAFLETHLGADHRYTERARSILAEIDPEDAPGPP